MNGGLSIITQQQINVWMRNVFKIVHVYYLKNKKKEDLKKIYESLIVPD